MKKCTIILISGIILSSISLFFLLAHFVIIKPNKHMQDSIQVLTQKQQVLAEDFEQVYLQEKFEIYPSDDYIIIELNEKSNILKCYYNSQKEFVNYEIIPVMPSSKSLVLWIVVALLSILSSIVISGITIGVIDVINKAKAKYYT